MIKTMVGGQNDDAAKLDLESKIHANFRPKRATSCTNAL
jgi:hypothetical protein